MSRLSPGISVPRTRRIGRLLSRTGWIRHRCRGGSRWRSDAGALGRLVLGDGDDRRTLAHLPVQLAEGSVERPVAGRHDRHVEALRVNRPDQRVIRHDIGPPPLDGRIARVTCCSSRAGFMFAVPTAAGRVCAFGTAQANQQHLVPGLDETCCAEVEHELGAAEPCAGGGTVTHGGATPTPDPATMHVAWPRVAPTASRQSSATPGSAPGGTMRQRVRSAHAGPA